MSFLSEHVSFRLGWGSGVDGMNNFYQNMFHLG